MPNIIAIDIVLLPDEKTTDLAIRLSESLPISRPFKLNKTDRLPHITLAMAYIETEKLNDLIKSIALIATQTMQIKFTNSSVRQPTNSSSFSAIGLERTTEVDKLHNSICKILQPLHLKSVDPNRSFVLEVNEELLSRYTNFVQHFLLDRTGENFWPYITLGVGSPSKNYPTKIIQANRLAIAQLGNYCTCRKLLAEWKLK